MSTPPVNAAKLGPYSAELGVAWSRMALLCRMFGEVTAVVARSVGLSCSDISMSLPRAWT